MPVYDFTCAECGARFEKRIPFAGNHQDVTCPQGHRAVRRMYAPPQVVFKGSGWYVTDHRKPAPSARTETSE